MDGLDFLPPRASFGRSDPNQHNPSHQHHRHPHARKDHQDNGNGNPKEHSSHPSINISHGNNNNNNNNNKYSYNNNKRQRILLRVVLRNKVYKVVAWFLFSFAISYMVYGNSFYFLCRSQASIQNRRSIHDRAIVQGMAYLRSLDTSTTTSTSPNNNNKASRNVTTTPTICMAISATQRKVPYVQALIASLLLGNDPKDISTLDLHILPNAAAGAKDERNNNRNNNNNNNNNNNKTRRMLILDLEGIPGVVPFLHIHDTKPSKIEKERASDTRANLNQNYAALLETCLQYSTAPWIVALEEDTILCRDFIPKLNDIFSQSRKEVKKKDKDNNHRRTAFIKLFVSDRWDGFEAKNLGTTLVQMASVGAMVTLLLLFVLRLWIRITTRGGAADSILSLPVLELWLLLSLGLFLNSMLIGRQNVVALGDTILHLGKHTPRLLPLGGSHHHAHGQAMAYTREGAQHASDYLLHNSNSNIPAYFDVLLTETYLQDYPELVAFEVWPPLVQHMGVYSSFSKKNQGSFEHLGQHEGFRDNVFV
jgi:hypothetical protein